MVMDTMNLLPAEQLTVATSPGWQPSPEVSLMNDMDAALVALE